MKRNFVKFILFLGAIVNGTEAAYLREARNGSEAAADPPDRANESLPYIPTNMSHGYNTTLSPTMPGNNTTPDPSTTGNQNPAWGQILVPTMVLTPMAGAGALVMMDPISKKPDFNKLVQSILDGSYTEHEINLSSNKLKDEDVAILMWALKSNKFKSNELKNTKPICDQITAINLSSNSLKTTLDISIFPNLTRLNISNNLLTFGPDISKCPKLNDLIINDNQLTAASYVALEKLQAQQDGLSITSDINNPLPAIADEELLDVLREHFKNDAREYFTSKEFMQEVLWCNKFASSIEMELIERNISKDLIIKILTEHMTNVGKGYVNRVTLQTRFFTSAFAQGTPEHAVLQRYIEKDLKATLDHAAAHIEKIIDNIFKDDGVAAKVRQRIHSHIDFNINSEGSAQIDINVTPEEDSPLLAKENAARRPSV